MFRRTIAAAIWLFFSYSTLLSFNSNPDPKWFDYASVVPLFLVLLALVAGYDRLLFQELDGWLSRLQRKALTKRSAPEVAQDDSAVRAADRGPPALSTDREENINIVQAPFEHAAFAEQAPPQPPQRQGTGE